MQLARPAFALAPARVRARARARARDAAAAPAPAISDDLKLFATTFVAGFLFVSVLIG